MSKVDIPDEVINANDAPQDSPSPASTVILSSDDATYSDSRDELTGHPVAIEPNAGFPTTDSSKAQPKKPDPSKPLKAWTHAEKSLLVRAIRNRGWSCKEVASRLLIGRTECECSEMYRNEHWVRMTRCARARRKRARDAGEDDARQDVKVPDLDNIMEGTLEGHVMEKAHEGQVMEERTHEGHITEERIHNEHNTEERAHEEHITEEGSWQE